MTDIPAFGRNHREVRVGGTSFWPTHGRHDSMSAWRLKDDGRRDLEWLPAPPWLVAAWHAGEPAEPLLDWLVEAHGAAHPWLAEAVAREFAGGGT